MRTSRFGGSCAIRHVCCVVWVVLLSHATAVVLAAQTAAPRVLSVLPPADGRYVGGQPLSFQVNFDRAVAVTATPRIAATLGTLGIPRYADYVSGSGTRSLRFVHVVDPGDWAPDGIGLSRMIDLNGGTIFEATTGSLASLDLPAVDARQVYVVNQPAEPPRVANTFSFQAIVGTPVHHVIAVGGSPTRFAADGLPLGLALETGAGVISGTPATSGVFRVAVSATNFSGTGRGEYHMYIYPADGAPLVMNVPWQTVVGAVGTPLRAGYGISATRSPTRYEARGLPPGLSVDPVTGAISGTPSAAGSYSATLLASNAAGIGSAVVRFDVAPRSVVVAVTPPVGGNYSAGDVLTFAVRFSTDVDIVSAPSPTMSLRLAGASEARSAALRARPASDTLIFQYTVTAQDVARGVIVERLDLNGGRIANAASGADADPSFSPVTAAGVNIVTPSPPPGAPVIATQATPVVIPTGSLFRYQISATNAPTSYSISGLPSGLTLNPATGEIRGVAGILVTGTFPVTLRASNSVGTAVATQLMSGGTSGPIEMPYVRSVVAPPAGTYRVGDTLTFVLECDVPYGGLTVAGTPRIAVTLGSKSRYATYVSSSALRPDRPLLTFRYVVAPGDEAPAGIVLSDTIDENGGTLRDSRGLYCALVVPPFDTSVVRIASLSRGATPGMSRALAAASAAPAQARPCGCAQGPRLADVFASLEGKRDATISPLPCTCGAVPSAVGNRFGVALIEGDQQGSL